MTTNSIIIRNPLSFMVESYLKKKFLNGKYSSGKIKIMLKDDIPNKILIYFDKEDLSDSFVNDYNGKSLDKNIDYVLIIEKTQQTEEEIQKDLDQNKVEYEPYNFETKYENEWKVDYVNSPDKAGLLYINEEEKNKIYKTIKYLITKFGKNIFEGKSIINISFPMFFYDKRTYAQLFAYEHRLAPYFLSKAVLSKDKMERLKWVIVHFFSLHHITTIEIQPFKPILGETFQCRIGDFVLYLENTSDDCLVHNFYGFDDNKNYKIYGYQISDVITSPNSVVAPKLGKYFIEFKDGSKYLLRFPNMSLKGIAMGDRTFNYTGKIVICDIKNSLCVYVEMNPEEVGFLKSFFKKKTTFPDYFKGQIVESSYVKIDEKGCNHILNKGAKSICNIEGEWTSYLKFDNVEYWDIEDYQLLPMRHYGYLCPSDSSLRVDLINFKKDAQEKSLIEKEKIEAEEERDKNLRKKYKSH